MVFFYFFGALFITIGAVLGIVEVVIRIATGTIATATAVLVAMLIMSGLQFLLFAVWFDMEYNRTSR